MFTPSALVRLAASQNVTVSKFIVHTLSKFICCHPVFSIIDENIYGAINRYRWRAHIGYVVWTMDSTIELYFAKTKLMNKFFGNFSSPSPKVSTQICIE